MQESLKPVVWHCYSHESLYIDVKNSDPCRAYKGECASCKVLQTMDKIRMEAESYKCTCNECTECVRRNFLLREVTGEKREKYDKKYPCECENAYERCMYGNRYFCISCGFGTGGMRGSCQNEKCTYQE